MKLTLPARAWSLAHYAPAASFCVVAMVASFLVYESLPEQLATDLDFGGRPANWMAKENYVAWVLGIMWGVLIFFLSLDEFTNLPVLPVPIVAATVGGIELFLLLVHLWIINVYDLGVPHFIILGGAGALALACIFAHCRLARTGQDGEPQGLPLWVDYPPLGPLEKIFFVLRPLYPSETRAHEEGLILRALLYTVAVPWDAIVSITRATKDELFGTGIRLTSNVSCAVKLTLSGTRWPLFFSIEDERRLLEEWEKRQLAA